MRFFEEFKTFIQRGNVIDLAVAVIIGGAFNGIVNSLVTDVFTPLFGIATQGNDAFSQLDIPLYHGAQIKIGAFLKAVLNFFVIAFCVFMIIKAANALRLEKLLAGQPKVTEMTPQEKLLTEIRDLLKVKQEPAPTPTIPENPKKEDPVGPL